MPVAHSIVRIGLIAIIVISIVVYLATPPSERISAQEGESSPSTATTTPPTTRSAATTSGDLVVVPGVVQVGQTTLAVGLHVLPFDLEVVIEYSGHFVPDGESCDDAGKPGTTQRAIAPTWITLNACTVGDGWVRLVESGTSNVIEEVSATITSSRGVRQLADPSVTVSGVTSSELVPGRSGASFSVVVGGIESGPTYDLTTVALNRSSAAFNRDCDIFIEAEEITRAVTRNYTVYGCIPPGTTIWSYLDLNGVSLDSSEFPGPFVNVKPPTVSFRSSSYSVDEGSSATITVELSYESHAQIRIPITVSNGTAESSDYDVNGLPSGRLTFSSRDTSESFTIEANQDTDENDETVNLGFGSLPSNVSGTGSPSRATLTIEDDDPVDPDRPPSTPRNLTLTAGDSEIRASWTVPSDRGSPALNDYSVQYREGTSGTWTEESHTGTATSNTITRLTNGTSYQVRVAAKNSHGTSGYTTKSATPYRAPSEPRSLTLTAGDSEIRASWTVPSDRGSPALNDYSVQYREGTSGTWTEESHTGTATSNTMTRLTNGTSYQVRVAAKNRLVTGPYTPPETATPMSGPPPTPPAPAGFSATVGGGAWIYLYWDSRDGITDYQIDSQPPNGQWKTVYTGDGDTFGNRLRARLRLYPCDMSGRIAQQFRIKAEGDGTTFAEVWSLYSNASVDMYCPPPVDYTATSAGQTSVNLSWSSRDGVLRYRAYYKRVVDDPFVKASDQIGEDRTDYTVTGLNCGTRYRFSVGVLGDGSTYAPRWSAFKYNRETTTDDCDETPSLPSVPNKSGTVNTALNIQLPAATGGDPPLTYSASPLPSGLSFNTSTRRISGTPTTAQSVTVTYVVIDDDGDTETSTFTFTITSVPNTPGRPSATTLNSTSIEISWVAPAHNNSPLTAYTVRYQDRDGDGTNVAGPWTEVSASASSTSREVSGLTPATRYNFEIKATNGIGDSGWSPNRWARTVPRQVSTPSLTPGNGSLTVSWSAPSGGSWVSSYELQYKRTSLLSWTNVGSLIFRQKTISGLTNSLSYHVQVQACNSAGCGLWSSSATGTPTPPPPTISVSGLASKSYAENGTDPVATYSADRSGVTWSLSGDDAGDFYISSGGVLRFRSSPNYESPQDEDEDNEYLVTVRASDGSLTASIRVTITVTNVDELPIPAVPTNATSTASDATVTLDWDDMLHATGYDVQYWVMSASDCCWVLLDPNDASNPYPITFSGSSAVIEGLANGSTHRHRVRSKNSSGESKWTRSISTPLKPKLAAPTNLDVVPLPLRKARLTWTGDPNADQYKVVFHESRTTTHNITVTDTHLDISLDSIFSSGKGLANSPYQYDFEVRAQHSGNSYQDGAYSEAVTIIDNPVLVGGRANGHSSSGNGQAELEWDRVPNVQNYTVRYRQLGDHPDSSPRRNLGHTTASWPDHEDWPYYGPFLVPVSVPQTSSRTVSETVGTLEMGELYAFQVNYVTTSGEKVFSARDAYVWPSDTVPTRTSRVGTYPFFGYWEGGNYGYTICTDTFSPPGSRGDWADLIHHAFEQWEEAAPDLLTVTRVSERCLSDDGSPIDNDVPMSVIRALYNESNEVYMVDRSGWPPVLAELWITANNKLFFCIVFGNACVISPRYWDQTWVVDPRKQSVRALDEGSVDVLVHSRLGSSRRSLDIPGGDASVDPSDIRFNICQGGSRKGYGNYETMVHEAGHALGLSNFDYNEPFGPSAAHPSIPDAVMNEDWEVDQIDREHDCSPHPFDIMGVEALYQTVIP